MAPRLGNERSVCWQAIWNIASKEMGMVFRHVDATERMLAERTARANDTMKAANWMLQQR